MFFVDISRVDFDFTNKTLKFLKNGSRDETNSFESIDSRKTAEKREREKEEGLAFLISFGETMN